MKRLLVIQTASIGDVILATAIAENIHRALPGVIIDFLVKKGNDGLFRHHPFINELIVWDKNAGKYRNLLGIILKIRKNHYDHVINVQRFFTSGLITILSGCKNTTGFNKNPLSPLFTTRVKHSLTLGLHETERNLPLIGKLTGSDWRMPVLYPSGEDELKAEQLVKRNSYTISPASLWQTKQFPAERWIELIRCIPEGSLVFLLGSPADYLLCETIQKNAAHPGIINLAGKLSLLQSAALMKRCIMNFTNDSSPMHLASSVNAPVTAIFCSTIPEFGFGPLSENSFVAEIKQKLSCRPCGIHGKSGCPEKHFKCAREIDMEDLVNRLNINNPTTDIP